MLSTDPSGLVRIDACNWKMLNTYRINADNLRVCNRIVFLSVPSAVLNLGEGAVSETFISVSWTRNPQSLQDKFQVRPYKYKSLIGLSSVHERNFFDFVTLADSGSEKVTVILTRLHNPNEVKIYEKSLSFETSVADPILFTNPLRTENNC